MTSSAMAEQRISAVHAFPETLIYTQSFLSFVDMVNERGEGVIQIDVRGGPEAIGMFQQADAVRDGIVGHGLFARQLLCRRLSRA